MRKSPVDKYKAAHRKTQASEGPKPITVVDLAKLLMAGHLPEGKRELNPTQWEFVCSPHQLNMYMGRAGAAKTSTLVGGGLLQCLFEAGTRWLIGRRDYNDLKDTTMRRFFEMVDRLPPGLILDINREAPMKVWIRPVVGEEPSEVTFMGLNDPISGHEYHRITIDEADEVEEARIDELLARMRAPGEQTRRLDGAMNPPDVNSFWYTRCTGRNAKGKKVAEPSFALFRPQSGENDRNLPPDYYASLRKTMGPERAQRLIDGEWGAIFDGKPVYREFSRKVHVKRDLMARFDPHEPVFRFWDFGYQHPFCIWAQMTPTGHLLALLEHSHENVEASVFAREVIALGTKTFGARARYIDFGDIAVKQKKDTGSTLARLQELGIRVQYNQMNIEPSIDVIRKQLNLMIEGEPALQFDEGGVPILISAMSGGYRMDKKGEAPLKDGFYDHPADAYRYGIWPLFGPGRGYVDFNTKDASVAAWDSPQFGGSDLEYRPEFDAEW